MSSSVHVLLVFSFLLYSVRCNVIWDTSNTLQPVHGLYVKPSSDGTTGDLYVAATEDNGIKSQWLTDQPVNFITAASQNQPKAVPVTFTSSLTKTSSPKEETITSQKRAVITSPAVRYAYALPVPGAEGTLMTPYPYPMAASPAIEGSSMHYCPTDNSAHPYPPFQYYYPPMMSAIANAMNIWKEGDTSDGNSQSIPQIPAYWPPSYGYPYQYVMVDPNSWSQNQSGASATTSSSANSASSETS